MENPRISILTPSYNQGGFIERNILSVMNQNYGNVEHIIIDGGSQDNTVEILKKYPHIKWISEKDKGQADALNKGILLATGDIIGWINSDDFYEENIFELVAELFRDKTTEWVIGNLKQIDLVKLSEHTVRSPYISFNALVNDPDIVKQPSTFLKKSLIMQAGGWNDKFYMVMDYDLWIRMSKIAKPVMIDRTLANFAIHGEQKSSIKNIIRQMHEIRSILKREKVSFLIISHIMFRKRKSLFKKRIKSIFNI